MPGKNVSTNAAVQSYLLTRMWKMRLSLAKKAGDAYTVPSMR